MQDQYLQSVVSPLKDVEGLHHQFLFNLYHKFRFSPSFYQPFDPSTGSIRFISPLTLSPPPPGTLPPVVLTTKPDIGEQAPEGTVKSILPCTPLAIVKVLEHIGVYNKMLEYGDRARGKVITVINRYAQP